MPNHVRLTERFDEGDSPAAPDTAGNYSHKIFSKADGVYIMARGGTVSGPLATSAGGDADAIHDNVSGEIAAITEKVTPVSADLVIIEDSAASNAKKKVQVGNLPGGSGAPAGAQYLTLAADATLTAERVLTHGVGLQTSDAGAGGAYTVTMDPLAGLASYNMKMARQEKVTLAASGTVTMINYSGSGMVTTIWLAINGSFVCRNALVKVYVDGEVSPSVQFDLGTLGGHWSTSPARFETRHIGIGDTNPTVHIVFKYPIPFSTSIQIDISNPTGTSGTLYTQVFYTTDITSSRRLKSSNVDYANKVTVADGATYDFLNLSSGNAGVIVWHSMVAAVASDNTFMEADVRVFVDGEATPSIDTTGTEDWFMDGFYFHNATHEQPWAYVSAIDLTNHVMAASLDLWELFGGIKYSDGVILRWDLTETIITTGCDISYLVLYYED